MGRIKKYILYQCFNLILLYTILLIPFPKSTAKSIKGIDTLKPFCSFYTIKDVNGKDCFISNFAILNNSIWLTDKTEFIYCLKNGKQYIYNFSNQSKGLLNKYEYDSILYTKGNFIKVDEIISGYNSIYFISKNNGILLRLERDTIYNIQLPFDSNDKYSFFDNYFVDKENNLWMIYHNLETNRNTLYCIRNDSVYLINIKAENILEFIVSNNRVYTYEYKYEGTNTKNYILVYENDKLLSRTLLTNFFIGQDNKFFRVNDKIYLLNSVGDLCELSEDGNEVIYSKLNLNYSKHFSCFWLFNIGNDLFVSNIEGIQKINIISNINKLIFDTRTKYNNYNVRDIQINSFNEIFGIYDGTIGCNYKIASFLIKIKYEN